MDNFFKPTLQTTFGDEGNCLSAVIATLFDVHIDDVPNFAEHKDAWLEKLSSWMTERFNKCVVSVDFVDDSGPRLLNGSLSIVTIDSARSEDARHAVIVRDNTVVFDPMIGLAYYPLTQSMNPTYILVLDVRH